MLTNLSGQNVRWSLEDKMVIFSKRIFYQSCLLYANNPWRPKIICMGSNKRRVFNPAVFVVTSFAHAQVVTLCVYIYFLFSELSEQFVLAAGASKAPPIDLYVPIISILQFLYYMGWLKVSSGGPGRMGAIRPSARDGVVISVAQKIPTCKQVSKFIQKMGTIDGWTHTVSIDISWSKT